MKIPSFTTLVTLAVFAALQGPTCAAAEGPVKVYILAGQSNMVGIGQVDSGGLRWGDEFIEPALSVYEGAYDPKADYDALKPVKTLALASFGGTEPTPFPGGGVQVVRGGTTLPTTGKPLFDYVSYANVFRLCAASSASVATAPAQAFFGSLTTFPAGAQANRCAALKAAGLLTSTTAAAQADEALQKMRTYGWEPESDLVHASMSFYEIDPSVSTTFGNALSRASVTDNLCGLSFAATDTSFHPTAVNATALAQMAAVGNGIPPTSGVQLVNNNAQGGPMRSNQSVDSTGTQAANLDGALCLRNLLTGADAASQSLQAGIRQTLRTGNLQGKPALIVQGRNDALLPVNHGSRPYLGLNAKVEGGSSKLSYIEVMNAQHFDGFIDLVPGYDTLFVPLVLYEQRALDAMYANLKNGTPLPPSQVVRTTPRGGTPGAAPAINAANLPNFTSTPAAGDRISVSVSGGVATVSVPN